MSDDRSSPVRAGPAAIRPHRLVTLLDPGNLAGQGNRGALLQTGIGLAAAAVWTGIDRGLGAAAGPWPAAAAVIGAAVLLNGGRAWWDAGRMLLLCGAGGGDRASRAGLVAGAVLVLLQVVALALSTRARLAATIAAPVLGRWAVVVAATGVRSAPGAARLDPGLTFEGFAAASVVALGILFGLLGLAGIVAFLAAGGAALALRLLAHRRLGFLPRTGLGAACELAQAAVLLALAGL